MKTYRDILTEEAKIFIGKTKTAGFSKSEAETVLPSYKDKGAAVSQRPGHKGWWISIPK
jgi:hypothetical protein